MKIELSQLSYTVGGRALLQNIQCELASGSFTSVLGPSGAGKTTLVNLIAGLLAPTAGSIRFDGTPVEALPAHKRQVAMVFQDARLFPHMNVVQNVAFSLRMQGVPKAERLRRASEFLERVQLPGFETRRIQTLSGGQAQRVALARALAAQPRALLLDEPFSGLDEHLRRDMRELVCRLQRTLGLTLVLVTHDAREALLTSDCILSLASGVLLQASTPQELLTRPINPEVLQGFGELESIEGTVHDGAFYAGKLRLLVGSPRLVSSLPPHYSGPALLLVRASGPLQLLPLSA